MVMFGLLNSFLLELLNLLSIIAMNTLPDHLEHVLVLCQELLDHTVRVLILGGHLSLVFFGHH